MTLIQFNLYTFHMYRFFGPLCIWCNIDRCEEILLESYVLLQVFEHVAVQDTCNDECKNWV